MHRRILTSALTLLAATTAAGAAQASQYTITGSGSHDISDTGGDDWTKDTKWGDFGASYGTSYDIHSNYNGSDKYEQVTGSIGGTLFGADIPIGEVSVKAHAGRSSTLKGDYDLSIFGIDLISIDNLSFASSGKSGVSITLAEFELEGVTYTADGNWGSDGLDLSVDVTATVGADLKFVGIPVEVSAGAAGAIGINVSATAGYDSGSGVSSIDFTGEPYAEIDLIAEAGVGAGVASVGVSGSLTLLHVGLPITNSLSLTPKDTTEGVMNYSTSGYLTLSSLGGEVDLFLKVWPVTYTYKLFDWDGVTWDNQLLFTDSIPTAVSPKITISGPTATLSYVYTDATNINDSKISWYRANDASGSGSVPFAVAGGRTYNLSEIFDEDKYMRACVKPYNSVNYGTTVCSSWTAVGHLYTMYKDSNYGGSSVSVAYSHKDRDHCYNMSDLGSSWNDTLSSLRIYNESGCNSVLYMYKDADCSGDGKGVFVSPNQTVNSVSSMSSEFGSSWNDSVSSFKVSPCEEVSATDVAVTFDATAAKGSYDLHTNALIDSDTSTSTWWAATGSSGSGATQLGGGPILGLSPAQAGNYLRFCVTPQAFISSGSEVCSDWTHVPAVVFYKDTSFGGSSMVFPYTQSPSKTCFNIADIGAGSTWNDAVGSLKLYAPLGTTATLKVFKDADCSGDKDISTVASDGASVSVSSVNNTFGSGWNDEISSFKVTY